MIVIRVIIIQFLPIPGGGVQAGELSPRVGHRLGFRGGPGHGARQMRDGVIQRQSAHRRLERDIDRIGRLAQIHRNAFVRGIELPIDDKRIHERHLLGGQRRVRLGGNLPFASSGRACGPEFTSERGIGHFPAKHHGLTAGGGGLLAGEVHLQLGFNPLDLAPETGGVPLAIRIGKGELAAGRIGHGESERPLFFLGRSHAAAAFEKTVPIDKLLQIDDVIHAATQILGVLRVGQYSNFRIT